MFICVLTDESVKDSTPLNQVVIMVSSRINCTERTWKKPASQRGVGCLCEGGGIPHVALLIEGHRLPTPPKRDLFLVP